MPNDQNNPRRRSPSEQATNTSLTPPEQDVGPNAERKGPQEASQMPPKHDQIDDTRPGRQESRGRGPGGTPGGGGEGGEAKRTGGQDQVRAQSAVEADPAAGPIPSRRPMKEFRDFIDAVTDLPFMRDHDRAEAAVVNVLGVLASNMSPDDAREITKNLPEPLNLETLRGQKPPSGQSAAAIARELKINEGQTGDVIKAVLKTLKGCIPEEQHRRVQAHLPQGWDAAFDATV